MPSRKEKVAYLTGFADAIQEFANEYKKLLTVAHKAPSNVIDMMYDVAVSTDTLHRDIANRYEQTETPAD